MKLSVRRRGDLSRELRDFYAHEPGAPASNFGGIANLALSGVRTSGGNPFGGDAAALRVHRVRLALAHHADVRKALRSLHEVAQLVLWLAFGARHLPPEVRKHLGETAGAALITTAAVKGCQKAAGTSGAPSEQQVRAWLLRRCVEGDTATLAPVVEGRDELVETALLAYSEARHIATPKRPRKPRKPSSGGSFFSPEGYGL